MMEELIEENAGNQGNPDAEDIDGAEGEDGAPKPRLSKKERLMAIIAWASTSASFLVIVGAFFVLSTWFTLNKPRTPNIDISPAFSGSFDNFTIHNPPRAFAPDLVMYDSRDMPQTIEKTNGQYRLINFWATWCTPCLKEIPSLLNLADRYRDKGMIVQFVSLDYPENAEDLMIKMKRKDIPPIDFLYVKDFEIWQKFGIIGLPTTVLVSPRGYIYYTMAGDMNWIKDSARGFIKAVVKK